MTQSWYTENAWYIEIVHCKLINYVDLHNRTEQQVNVYPIRYHQVVSNALLQAWYFL